MQVSRMIEQASAVKDTRTYMNKPYYDGKRVIATDGHIIAITRPDAKDEGDTAGSIPIEALKAARKQKHAKAVLLTAVPVCRALDCL